jgi:hypothetical protein
VGYVSKTHTLTANRSRYRFQRHLSAGILYAACVIPSDTNARGCQMFAEIGIMEPPPDNDTVVAILTSGYFGVLNRLYWTGKFPINEDSFIFCDVYGPATALVRFTWYQLKPPVTTNIHEMIDP